MAGAGAEAGVGEGGIGAGVSEVLQQLATAGVAEFCVCAGARNVELVVGLERSSGCRVWHFFEERSAAFFALGRMMKTGRPVAVVTTSGTAVAELLPATIEAYYQGLPLVLVTADRPERFRGSGAPQAIEQVGIFGAYAESFEAGQDILAKPVHLNVSFEEPSSESVAAVSGVDFVEGVLRRDTGDQLPEKFFEQRDQILVMLGNLHLSERDGLEAFLTNLGAPVLAEAGSGLREKLSGLVVREVPEGITRVLRIGGVPSARFWRDLEGHPEVEVLSVAGFSGLARESMTLASVDWSEQKVSSREATFEHGEYRPTGEALWFRFLSEVIPEKSLVYLGQ